MDTDVVVVGAGPTGLALACGLRAAGVGVRVFDKAQGPAVTSRALGLQPRGVEVLHRLGALGDLPERAIPIGSVVIHVDGRKLASFEVGRPTRLGGPRGLIMSQADIEGALRERLTELGGTVEWSRSVCGLTAHSDGVTLRLDDGPEVAAGWVIGADGAHSVVRKALGIGFPGVPIVERFLLADVHADVDRPRDGALAWLRGDKVLAAFPLPGTDLWRVMAPAPQDMSDDAEQDEIVDHLGSRLATEVRGSSVRSVEWTSTFRIQRRLADTYRRGRVMLAGDAAHIHSPLGGQGMNTGIGDAENLAWKLALVVGGRADAKLLDTYESERRPIAKEVLESTSGVTAIAVGNGRLSRLLRDRVAVPLMNLAWTQRLVAEKASQLQVSYRHGPLGAGRWHRLPGLRPGDRIPDYDGLYDALGPGWALLGPEQVADAARQRLGDVVTLSGDGDAMLVRPDGHLAWRGADATSLHAWLDSALGRHAGVLAP